MGMGVSVGDGVSDACGAVGRGVFVAGAMGSAPVAVGCEVCEGCSSTDVVGTGSIERHADNKTIPATHRMVHL